MIRSRVTLATIEAAAIVAIVPSPPTIARPSQERPGGTSRPSTSARTGAQGSARSGAAHRPQRRAADVAPVDLGRSRARDRDVGAREDRLVELLTDAPARAASKSASPRGTGPWNTTAAQRPTGARQRPAPRLVDPRHRGRPGQRARSRRPSRRGGDVFRVAGRGGNGHLRRARGRESAVAEASLPAPERPRPRPYLTSPRPFAPRRRARYPSLHCAFTAHSACRAKACRRAPAGPRRRGNFP